jgi:large subunit ribosomal protein L23
MNVRAKKKRQGRTSGYTSRSKKAIVTLKEGSKEIEFFQGL